MILLTVVYAYVRIAFAAGRSSEIGGHSDSDRDPLLSPQSKLLDALLHTKEEPMFPRKAPNRRGAASANQNANAAKGRQPQSQMLGAAEAAAHYGRRCFRGRTLRRRKADRGNAELLLSQKVFTQKRTFL